MNCKIKGTYQYRPARVAALCLAVLLAMLCLCTGCGNTTRTDPSEDGVLRVVCTTFPGWEFCRAVTGIQAENAEKDGVEVHIISKQGQDLHGYEPSAADIGLIATADVFVYVGGTSDAWVENALKAAGNQSLVTVSMMDVCPVMEEKVPEGAEDDHDDGDSDGDGDHGTEVEYDEHLWTSIRNDRLIVQAIADALAQADPTHEETYRANAAAYDEQLAELDAAYTDTVAGAARHTLLIADRYPFAYLMRDLGLTCYAAFPGCSSETQASFATQVFLVEKVKELGLPCIFMVDNGQGSVAASISQQTGAEVLRLWSGQTLPEDPGMTYLDMLRENLENLKKALG